MMNRYLKPEGDADFVKGLLAGMAGGLLASLVMEQFQAAWTKVGEAIEKQKPKKGGRKSQPATVKAAESISQNVLGRKIPKSKKKLAGEALHYAMGATSGAIYGALTEASPITTVGDGLAFGTAVWLLADEVSVPALGFSKSPAEIPVTTHVYALVSHLVYGWTTEVVRRAIRKAL